MGSGERARIPCGEGARAGRTRQERARDDEGEPRRDGGQGRLDVRVGDDVDAVHAHCQAQGLEITMPPTDEPWGVREMHLRHPDGHVFRISREGKGG